MESTIPVTTVVPMPGETLQATFRVSIKVEKNSNTGEVKTFIGELDIANYDGLIKDVPEFLKDYNIPYALNLIQQDLKAHAL